LRAITGEIRPAFQIPLFWEKPVGAGFEHRMLPKSSRLKRLAESIDALADKDQELLSRAREMAGLRRRAATGLYGVCSSFVASVNQNLVRSELALDPPSYTEAAFREDGPNLFQINALGRILQIEFAAAPDLVSTEDFRIPYTLAGAVRAFNQRLLENYVIEEQLIYYTLEKEKKWWRYFDPRTHRTGPVDEEYLLSLMELAISH
jgi:hypothetical protein